MVSFKEIMRFLSTKPVSIKVKVENVGGRGTVEWLAIYSDENGYVIVHDTYWSNDIDAEPSLPKNLYEALDEGESTYLVSSRGIWKLGRANRFYEVYNFITSGAVPTKDEGEFLLAILLQRHARVFRVNELLDFLNVYLFLNY